MSNPADERRRFHRIATDKPVKITAGSAVHPGTVLDLSLRGLLFEVADDWQPDGQAPCCWLAISSPDLHFAL